MLGDLRLNHYIYFLIISSHIIHNHGNSRKNQNDRRNPNFWK